MTQTTGDLVWVVRTLRQLLSKTPREVKLRAQNCGYALDSEQDVKPQEARGRRPYLEQIYTAHCLDGDKQCTLRFQAGVASKDSLVWVSCTCGYHKYFVEWALASVGSSSIIYCNGDPPFIRNPKRIPYLCKHLFAIGTRLQSGTKKRRASAGDDTRDDATHLLLRLLAEGPMEVSDMEQELANLLTISQMRDLFHDLQLAGSIRAVGTLLLVTQQGLERLVTLG